jgi:uncharacterized protein (TIGR02145 family)
LDFIKTRYKFGNGHMINKLFMLYKKVSLSSFFLFCISLVGLQAQMEQDIDGNVYKTVTIGNQLWMAENLKTINCNDGTAIPLVADDSTWGALTTPAYCWFNNDSSYKKVYGALYNWYTVKTGKICPIGWHVPTDADWTTLTTYLGGESVAGGKLKEARRKHWLHPNTGATNETGFTALPCGKRLRRRLGDSSFHYTDYYGFWWSSTEQSSTSAYFRSMCFGGRAVDRFNFNKQDGVSVRCLQDY